MNNYNLRDNGVKMIKYTSELHQNVARSAQLWKEFCQLPVDVKQILATTETQSGVGYESKDGKGVNADRKENFDYSDSQYEQLKTIITDLDNDTVTRFVTSIADLYHHLEPMIGQFSTDINEPSFAALSKKSYPSAFFSFSSLPKWSRCWRLNCSSAYRS